MKFEQSLVARTTRNFELLTKTKNKKQNKKTTKQQQQQQQQNRGFKSIFDKLLTPFSKTFLWLKQLLDAKLLIRRLPSISVSKITVVRHV